MVQREGLVDKLSVTADGTGLVGHAGSVLLVGVADRVGLTRALSVAMAPTRQRASAHDPGVLLRDLAVMLADGGTCLADLGAQRDQPDLYGNVASDSTAFRRHPVDGAEMVASLGNEELTSVVRHHHERMDGKGYPDGLAGEQIPLGARIIAVADTFDAITSVRPYRPRRAHKQALDILTAEQGLQLDRDAVRAFLHCYSGRRSIALWTVTASVLQRAVSWMTGEATAATITTGNVVATAVATVAIGGVAMTSAVVARVDPSRPAGNAHASARPGHAPLGQGLGVPEAGGPAGGHLSPEVFSACMGQARAFGLLSVWDDDIRVIPATRPTESSTLTALGNLTRGVDSAVATSTARASVRLFSAVAPAPALPLDTPRAPTAPTPEAAGQLALDQRIPATGKARAAPPQENATGAGGVRVPVVVAPSPLPEPHSGPQRRQAKRGRQKRPSDAGGRI